MSFTAIFPSIGYVLTNRVFFVFGVSTFWRVNYVTNVAPIAIGDFTDFTPFVELTKGTLIN
jgi:hypothetical protein